jgi:membrane associated rhomboid family serine protease
VHGDYATSRMAEIAERTCYRHPDRVTGLSCSECGRPICTECMTMAPVGIRCPEHSGRPQGVQRVARGVQRASFEGVGARVTKALIAINVAVYIAELAQGAGVNGTSGSIYEKGVLVALAQDHNFHFVGVAQGEYWRLITAAFMHYGPFHLLVNMVSLWWIGSLLEQRIGAGRFLGLYLASGLAGSAGALIDKPLSPTVGASGAIFGILGAGLILEWKGDLVFGGSALGLLVLNLVITLSFRGSISLGGHVGGLIGGALCMLAMTRFGRVSAAYGRPGVLGFAGIAGVAVASVVVAYLKARGYSVPAA